ncbi:MAG: hypothetical protein NTW76_03240 [Corynebacteriales bacterium]|uniref:Uncharacterized protein n=1 Tax=Williamsia herbipolensis TaxID=1603258 RepID=A0AAU4JZ79_9NOCA|nr:hypothetical protein [Williamsia herbipolensis]MCX6468309.1 hypothetical protein [Mycobacteriales bacterium]
MNIKKAATSTLAAGFVGAAMLGLGVTAGTANAAPIAPNTHNQQVQPQRQQPQREVTVTRPNYRPFTYRGVHVTPRYDVARNQWGFQFNRTFVHVVLARR